MQKKKKRKKEKKAIQGHRDSIVKVNKTMTTMYILIGIIVKMHINYTVRIALHVKARSKLSLLSMYK